MIGEQLPDPSAVPDIHVELVETYPARECNFNDDVLVRVRPEGERMWDEHHAGVAAFYAEDGQPNPFALTRDEEGYTRMPLWKVAAIYGSKMGMDGQESPIDLAFKYPPKIERTYVNGPDPLS